MPGSMKKFSGLAHDSVSSQSSVTTAKQPIRVKSYPKPYAKQKEVDKEVQKMLEAGVIEPSCSSYNSPIVLVKKKDGTNIFCIDFRRINAITKFDTETNG